MCAPSQSRSRKEGGLESLEYNTVRVYAEVKCLQREVTIPSKCWNSDTERGSSGRSRAGGESPRLSSTRLGQVRPRPLFRRLVGVNHEWEICKLGGGKGRAAGRVNPDCKRSRDTRPSSVAERQSSAAPVRAGSRDAGAGGRAEGHRRGARQPSARRGRGALRTV